MCNLRKTAFLSDTIYFMVRNISETKIFFSGKNEETILPHGLEESLFQLIFQWWVLATLEMFWRKFTFRENRLILCVFYKVHKIEYRTFQKRMVFIMTFPLVALKLPPGERALVIYHCRAATYSRLALESTEGHCIRNFRGNLKLTECNYTTWNLAKFSRFNITTHPGSL